MLSLAGNLGILADLLRHYTSSTGLRTLSRLSFWHQSYYIILYFLKFGILYCLYDLYLYTKFMESLLAKLSSPNSSQPLAKPETSGIILVTGATGGVGRRVVDILRKKGLPVRVLVSFYTNVLHSLDTGAFTDTHFKIIY